MYTQEYFLERKIYPIIIYGRVLFSLLSVFNITSKGSGKIRKRLKCQIPIALLKEIIKHCINV